MSSPTDIRDLLKVMVSRPVAFHAIFAHVCANQAAGLMLSQAFYWSEVLEKAAKQRAVPFDGWFFKNQREWHEETCLTRREQESSRRILRTKGFLTEERRGQPARLWFRLDFGAVAMAISQYVQNEQSRMRDSGELDGPECAPQSVQTGQTIRPETTSETTSEKNLATRALVAPGPPVGTQAPLRSAKAVRGERGAGRRGSADPRYQEIVAAIRLCWPAESPFAFDERDGKSLKELLVRRGGWTSEQLCICVAFRFWSAGANPALASHRWLPTLTDFASGPRDQYGKPLPQAARGTLEEWRSRALKCLSGEPDETQAATTRPAPTIPKSDERWLLISEKLQSSVSKQSWETWLRPVHGTVVGDRDCHLRLWVPTTEFCHVAEKYQSELLGAARALGIQFTKISLHLPGEELPRAQLAVVAIDDGSQELSQPPTGVQSAVA